MSILSPSIIKYVNSQRTETTKKEYKSRLSQLETFCLKDKKYGTMETVIDNIKNGTFSIYGLLSDFASNQTSNNTTDAGTHTIKLRINTAVNFLEEFTDLEVSRNKLKKRLKLGRSDERDKLALDREIIIKLLTNCTNKRLRAFLHLLAASGCRPKAEGLRLKIKDIVFNDEFPHIHFPAAITKTRKERKTFMTQELVEQLKSWIEYKYRSRNQVTILPNGSNNKTKTTLRTPDRNENDYLFSVYTGSTPEGMYFDLAREFHKLLKDVGLDKRHEDGRHLIVLKSFRDFVKSQISEQGHEQFSEFHIGHKKSTYWNITMKRKYETFMKIESAITYLNIDSIATTTQDIRSQSDAQKKEIVELKKQVGELKQEREDEIQMVKRIVNLEQIFAEAVTNPASFLEMVKNGKLGDLQKKKIKPAQLERQVEQILT